MSKERTIAILGCGWLGVPLAKSLIRRGYHIKGSTTTNEKLPKLTEVGIDAHLLELGSERFSDTFKEFIEDADVLVINFPPQVNKITDDQYSKAIAELTTQIEVSHLHKLILVSSISLYKDTLDFPRYTEENDTTRETEGAKRLFLTEERLKYLAPLGVRTSILRFGGLTGSDRHPVFHLAGKENIANPLGPLNLIHQEDCIGIIEAIIELDAFGEDFNAVYPEHPERKVYYQEKALEFALPIPEFNSEPSKGKIIDSGKVTDVLGYSFRKRP